MCATCGCAGDGKTTLFNLQTGETSDLTAIAGHPHAHVHADGSVHVHSHAAAHDHGRHPAHEHGHGHDHRQNTTLDLEARILDKNDALAAQNRAWLAGREVLALNLVSSPGSGKTALLERAGRRYDYSSHRRRPGDRE